VPSGGGTKEISLLRGRERPWFLSFQIWNFYITEIKVVDLNALSFKTNAHLIIDVSSAHKN
jgi:hypothetical protein